MNNCHCAHPCPYCGNTPMHHPNHMHDFYKKFPYPCWGNPPMHHPGHCEHCIPLKDYGPCPFVTNIEEATLQNPNFRIALWTGKYLQLTLMSINPGDDIGLEIHPDVDQFIRIEQGEGLTMMGNTKDCLDFQRRVCDDDIIIIPAGKWHNLINTGCTPLKLYSIYAPPEHPHGTIHRTKKDAEHHHSY